MCRLTTLPRRAPHPRLSPETAEATRLWLATCWQLGNLATRSSGALSFTTPSAQQILQLTFSSAGFLLALLSACTGGSITQLSATIDCCTTIAPPPPPQPATACTPAEVAAEGIRFIACSLSTQRERTVACHSTTHDSSSKLISLKRVI